MPDWCACRSRYQVEHEQQGEDSQVPQLATDYPAAHDDLGNRSGDKAEDRAGGREHHHISGELAPGNTGTLNPLEHQVGQHSPNRIDDQSL